MKIVPNNLQERYTLLKFLNPAHKLLKYFIFDESGFSMDGNLETLTEYFRVFKKNFPTREELNKSGNNMCAEEYQAILFATTCKNYLKSLEKAIEEERKID